MYYKIKSIHDIRTDEIDDIVHPRYIDRYCFKYGIKPTFELLRGQDVLVIRSVSLQDRAVFSNGDASNSLPLLLRQTLRTHSRRISSSYVPSVIVETIE
ncbi:hypothetical protein [Vibrio marisflavi]|uniref:Uncharacterized protein n=1 Tax=Vibrio marisflavi CECT 7928 TaxID=634439 RepID=A0ABM9A1B0_9VIBR|nr:hypothetical protein [Vibrio marisflavi]CAH0537515.1 hypothetical protein VMF7928_01148 [Vibrio marisflavi CECT 7928]